MKQKLIWATLPLISVAVFVLLSLSAVVASSRTLYGVGIHPWYDFAASLKYVASTKGLGIVRVDEQMPGTPVADVVARYDAIRAAGLQEDLLLVQACCDYNVTYSYVKALSIAMGAARKPYAVEILNEPDSDASWPGAHPWPAKAYWQALYSANNAASQAGLGNLPISMAGLALNDQAYLAASGIKNTPYLTQFVNWHAYPFGGSPRVGPLSPDDPDIAHKGLFSIRVGLDNMMAALPGKTPIIGETGYCNTVPDVVHASYLRALVSITKGKAGAVILYEVGGADPPCDLRNTYALQAFAEAARQ